MDGGIGQEIPGSWARPGPRRNRAQGDQGGRQRDGEAERGQAPGARMNSPGTAGSACPLVYR